MSRPIAPAFSARARRAAGHPSIPLVFRRLRGLARLKRILPLAAICLFLSCGVQGPPLPPRVERPERITDLAVIQKGRAFDLSFTLPTKAADGERLTKPLEIEIYRTVTPRGAAAAPLPESAAPAVVLKSADLPALTLDKKIIYPFQLSEQEYSSSLGAAYAFAVRGMTYGFRHRALEGQLSNVQRATLLDVSGRVEDLSVQPTEKAIELAWSPPALSLSGKPVAGLAGYRFYRSDSGKAGTFEQRGMAKEPAYSDSDFVFDHTYFYKVQAQFEGGHSTAESEESAVDEITPRDIFPPPSPRGVTAIYAAGAVQIVWSPSVAPDLAGYNVLRREDGGEETKINKELLRTPVFRDSDVQAGRRYTYRVTAQDFAGNQSPPSDPAQVEIR